MLAKYTPEYFKTKEAKVNKFLNTNVLKIKNIEQLTKQELMVIENRATILLIGLNGDKINYFNNIIDSTPEMSHARLINNNQRMELNCLINSINKELSNRRLLKKTTKPVIHIIGDNLPTRISIKEIDKSIKH